MNSNIISQSRLWSLSCLLLLVAPMGMAQTSGSETLELSTGLLGVTENETVTVRIVETNPRAEASRVVISYLNKRDRVVAVRSGVLAPGRPVEAEANGRRFGNGPLGAVRVLIRIEAGDFLTNEPVTTVEFFQPFDLRLRGGPTCGPGAGASGPQVVCPEFIVNLTANN